MWRRTRAESGMRGRSTVNPAHPVEIQRLCFEVAEVSKALAAVSALVDTNHRVVFDKDMKTGADRSVIIDMKTGISTIMRLERHVWVIDAWVDEKDTGMDLARPE